MSDRKLHKGLTRWCSRGSLARWIGPPLACLMGLMFLLQAYRALGCIGVDGTMPPDGGSKPNAYMVEKINLAHKIAKLNGLQTPTTPPITGNHKTVIILIEDSTDGAAFGAAYRPAALWHARLDQFDAYYNEASRGLLHIVPATESNGTANDGVIGPIRAASLSSTTDVGGTGGTSSNTYFVEAIRAANPYINFASFDTNGDGKITSNELHILVYQAGDEKSYSGSSTPRAWAHNRYASGGFSGAVPAADSDNKILTSYSYCGSEFNGAVMATQGQMTHEMGHDLGLPDLYDTDGSGSGGTTSGLGKHCLMASGSWGTNGGTSGDKPTHIDAYYKNWLGWETQTLVTAPGNAAYTLLQAMGNNRSVRINIAASNEFFIVENRQQVGYDAGLPDALGGLLIYHCDGVILGGGSAINNNPNNMGIAVEQANGSNSLKLGTDRGTQNDFFRVGNKTDFDNTSTPNSKLKSGAASGVDVSAVSASGASMTFNLGTVPPSIGTFAINSGAAYTTSRIVTLNNTWVGSVAPSHYMASESSIFTGASWLTYSAAPSFTLSTNNVTKTVYFKIKDAGGHVSATRSDTILLDEIVSLTIGSAWRSGTITPAGEIDWYSFTVTAAGYYAIETQAGTLTDNYMRLYGPGNRTTLITSDNDSGPGAMARILRYLGMGTYYVKNQAYWTAVTGSYSIRVIPIPPPTVTSLAIDNGALFTASRQVILSNTVTGSPTHYMASESSSFSGALWVPWPATAIPFTIASAGDGTKGVYFRVKNEAGTSAARADTITLKSITLYALLIYKTSSTDIDVYAALLKARGFNVAVVKLDEITRIDLSKIHVIVIGNETGDLATWGTTAQVSYLVNSRKPIVGIGEGGYAFFGKLTLAIGYPYGWHANEGSLAVVDGLHTVFNVLKNMAAVSGASLVIFKQSTDVGIYLSQIPAGVVPLGREPSDKSHYMLVQQGTRMLWGFSGNPINLTTAGQNLFENVVRFTAGMGVW